MEPIEKATLVAVADACGYALHAHVPEEAILRRFKSHLRGDARKALRKLVKSRLVQLHPTRGSMTYALTKEGLLEAQR